MSLAPLRPRFASEPGVPQYLSTQPFQIQWRSDDAALKPPIQPDTNPQRFKAFADVFKALFGAGDPNPDIQRDVQALAQKNTPFYVYHMGDLFTPGTQNFVFEPTTELTPLTTIWGNAFLSRPNAFRFTSPAQVYADYNKFLNGIGGLQTGQFALQPLVSVQTAGG